MKTISDDPRSRKCLPHSERVQLLWTILRDVNGVKVGLTLLGKQRRPQLNRTGNQKELATTWTVCSLAQNKSKAVRPCFHFKKSSECVQAGAPVPTNIIIQNKGSRVELQGLGHHSYCKFRTSSPELILEGLDTALVLSSAAWTQQSTAVTSKAVRKVLDAVCVSEKETVQEADDGDLRFPTVESWNMKMI